MHRERVTWRITKSICTARVYVAYVYINNIKLGMRAYLAKHAKPLF